MPKIVDHEERRAEISAALWRIVTRVGIGGVSIRSVAEEAGYPKATAMHYFRDEAELLMYAMDESIRVSRDRISTLIGPGARPGTEEFIQAILEAIPVTGRRRKQTTIWIEILSQSQSNSRLRAYLVGANEEIHHDVVAALTDMQRRGMVAADRDLDLEARRLHALIDGLSVQTMLSHKETSPRVIEDIVTKHVQELGRSLGHRVQHAPPREGVTV